MGKACGWIRNHHGKMIKELLSAGVPVEGVIVFIEMFDWDGFAGLFEWYIASFPAGSET